MGDWVRERKVKEMRGTSLMIKIKNLKKTGGQEREREKKAGETGDDNRRRRERMFVPVSPHLLEHLDIVTELGIKIVGGELRPLAGGNVLLPVNRKREKRKKYIQKQGTRCSEIRREREKKVQIFFVCKSDLIKLTNPNLVPVQEPVGDLELTGVLDDGHDLLDVLLSSL